MSTEIKNTISIANATKDFSKVIKDVELKGEVIITKNNQPSFIVSKYDDIHFTEDDMIELVARRILDKYKRAFEELAKW